MSKPSAFKWKHNRFLPRQTRDQKAAKRFFKKALRSFHVSKPRVITVHKNPVYPIAIEQLKKKQQYLMVCNLDNKST